MLAITESNGRGAAAEEKSCDEPMEKKDFGEREDEEEEDSKCDSRRTRPEINVAN
jgi:hypothetical protein